MENFAFVMQWLCIILIREDEALEWFKKLKKKE